MLNENLPAAPAPPCAPGPAPSPFSFIDEDLARACVHCGLCLSACPTYLTTGNENDSPRGRIYLMRAVQDGRLPYEGTALRHIDLCLGCRACEVACPSGVQYGALLEQARDHLEDKVQRPLAQRFLRQVVIERVFPFANRMRLALLPARFLRRTGLDRFLPGFAREMLSLVPTDPSAARLPPFSPALQPPAKMRVGLIEGCVMPVMFGRTNQSTLQLLTQAGCDVVVPQRQGCCGALYAHSGNLALAQECARKNIAAFEREQLDHIIINAAGCGSTLKEYGHLLAADAEWAGRARAFGAKVLDLSEWLAQHAPAVTRRTERVTYHDACHLAHAQRITAAPRSLVRAAAGDNYVELPEADVCCGSAGTYNLTEPAMAAALQKRKTDNILATGAEVVVTTNPGCILQIEAGLRKAGATKVRVMHLADYLSPHFSRASVKNAG